VIRPYVIKRATGATTLLFIIYWISFHTDQEAWSSLSEMSYQMPELRSARIYYFVPKLTTLKQPRQRTYIIVVMSSTTLKQPWQRACDCHHFSSL
jgi:hypothetical protein